MIVIKRDNPKIFAGKAYLMNEPEEIALNTIADVISIKRSPLVQLLQQYNVPANELVSKQELLNVLSKTYINNQPFALQFNQLFLEKRFSNATDPYTSATVEIMNAFKSIVGAFSKPDTSSQQLDFNQQILLLAQQKEEQKKKNQKMAIIAVVIVVLLAATITIYYAKKKKAI